MTLLNPFNPRIIFDEMIVKSVDKVIVQHIVLYISQDLTKRCKFEFFVNFKIGHFGLIELKQASPFFLFLGVVIQGWDIAVPSMNAGETSLFTIKPEYAYGKEGSGLKIPPDATLQFEIELVLWKGEDLTKDGQVTKIVLQKGEGYDKPNTGANCEGQKVSLVLNIQLIDK